MIFSVRRNPRSSRQGFRSCRGGWCDGRLGTIRCYRRPFNRKRRQRGRHQKKIVGSKREPLSPARPSPDTCASPRARYSPPRHERARSARRAGPPPANPRYAPRCVRCSSVESPTFSLVALQCSDNSPAAERGGKSRAQVSASPNRARPRALTASVALRAIPLLGGFVTASP